MSSAQADLTARARIRNAALAEFAGAGFVKATVRSVAARAEVSPALVLHHFGSKEGLRSACDEHLLAQIRAAKGEIIASGHSPSPMQYLRSHPDFTVLYEYMRRVLLDGGEAATTLFDDFVRDTASFFDAGERAGTVRPYSDGEARAVVMTAFGLGLMLFDRAVAARLGGEDLLTSPVLERYATFVVDLYRNGVLTDRFTMEKDS